jgi:hypothetical protein
MPVDPDLVVIVSGIVTTVVGYPIARAIGRRAENKAIDRAEVREFRQRLEGIEQAADAIAVEVERISEGQRFTTRLLSHGATEAELRTHEPYLAPPPTSRPPGTRTPR